MSNLAIVNTRELTDEQIDVQISQLMQTKLQRLEVKYAELNENHKRLIKQIDIMQEETKLSLETLRTEAAATKEIATAKMRVQSPKYEFVNQGDFGRFLSVSIGSRTIGKLLKIVGLAMKNKGKTTPYRQYIPNYAMTVACDNYTDVKWHYEKCIEFIDKWLQSSGYFDKFYSIDNTREMEEFINGLYDRFCS